MVEGVHFDKALSAFDVGFKLVAISVSDLASMGAQPQWCTLNLSLPEARSEWIASFARGLAEACSRWQVVLVGGDTTRTAGPVVVSLTLGGPCVGQPVRRDGAQLGDNLWVTGVLGLAGLGWRHDAPREASLAALRRPNPPLGFALEATRLGLLNAAMDISDGLSSDLPRLLNASGLGASVWPDVLPSHPDLDAVPAPLRRWAQLAGGDDYQLLLTASPSHQQALLETARRHGVRLTCIGAVRVGQIQVPGGWPTGAFQHFEGRP